MSTPQRTRPVFTVTRVSRRGGHIQTSRFRLTISTLPGETFGPYSFSELKRELLISALLDPATARDTALDALGAGTASIEGAFTHTTADMED